MEIDLNVFKENYLVSGLPDEDVRRVSELAEVKTVRSGAEIVRFGSTDNDLFVILDGTVKVHRHGGVLLGEHGPGSVIGEISLIDGHPRSAYVLSHGEVTYARFDADKLRRFMFGNLPMGFIMLSNLARVLSARLREASTNIEDLQGKLSDPWHYSDFQ